MSKIQKSRQHTVRNIKGKVRISDYCGTAFPTLGSKSATKKAIAAGRLRLNGRPAATGDWLRNGDRIELTGSAVKSIKKLDVDLETVYEDDHLLVVNKPGGIAVNGNRYKTVENALAHHNRHNPLPDALPRPVAVHRIDVPTCGLVVLAKSKTAQIKMGKAFQSGAVQKTYIAIAHGSIDNTGAFTDPVQGKKATTQFEAVEVVPSRVFGHLTKVRLQPITGRTHQLRIHLSNAGHPIVGDKLYLNDQKSILGKGVLLCAAELRFAHPVTGKSVELRVEVPGKFDRILKREADRFR